MAENPKKITAECGECRQPTVRTCDECGLSYCYGCEEQDHWRKCENFEVDFSEKCVSVRAKRELLAGETIFSEHPLVVGPRWPVKDDHVPCVGCCRLVSTDNISYCPECAWPTCSTQCEDLKNTKTHRLECQILKLAPTPESATNFKFEILLPLRILFLQTTNKPEWEHLIHRLENKTVEDQNFNKLNTQNDQVNFLQDTFLTPLTKIEEETATTILQHKSTNLLHKIIEFSKISTFEPPNDLPLQAVYPTAHLIPHNCTPNSFHTITNHPNLEITVRANSPIPKNSPITWSHTNPFQPTHERQTHLKTTKDISCTCDRCTDPTEFGTFFSALKCLGTRTEPCGGTQLPLDPTRVDTVWICDTCKIELPNDQMLEFVRHLGVEVGKAVDGKPTADELEEFLAKLLMFLHPNHFYVCRVKQKLAEVYDGEDLGGTKVEICEGLVEIGRRIFPFGSLVLVELLHLLFEAKVAVLSEHGDGVKNEDVEELGRLVDEMEGVTEGHFNVRVCEVVAHDRSIFTDLSRNRY